MPVLSDQPASVDSDLADAITRLESWIERERASRVSAALPHCAVCAFKRATGRGTGLPDACFHGVSYGTWIGWERRLAKRNAWRRMMAETPHGSIGILHRRWDLASYLRGGRVAARPSGMADLAGAKDAGGVVAGHASPRQVMRDPQ